MPVAPVLRSFVGVYSGRMALSMSLMTHSQPAPALLYQHVKEPGDCTVATRVHSFIPYGDSGLLILWELMDSNHRSYLHVLCLEHHLQAVVPK